MQRALLPFHWRGSIKGRRDNNFMKLLGLRTLIYPSNDLETDKTWWAQALGFQPYFDQSFYVGFDVGGYELGLIYSPHFKR